MAFASMPRPDRFMGVSGPIARSVADLVLLMRTLAGPDGVDHEVPPVPWRDVPRKTLGELKIAFRASFPGVPTSRTVTAAVTRLAQELESRGATVEERDPYSFEVIRDAWQANMRVIGAMMGELIGARLPVAPPPGPPVSAADTARLLALRDQAISSADAALVGFDAFLSPACISVAFPHSAPRSPIAVDGEEVESRFVDHYLYPWNLTGHPAVVIPAGLSEEGLPIGVQLVGRRWADEDLLAVAGIVGELTGGFRAPPGLDRLPGAH
jgi:amidase